MSRIVENALRHFNELKDAGPDSELFHLRQDIERAIEKAPLTDDERHILTALYFTDSQHPIRQPQSGRPSHPHAAELVAIAGNQSENAKAILISRRLKLAIQKLADFLGTEYSDETV